MVKHPSMQGQRDTAMPAGGGAGPTVDARAFAREFLYCAEGVELRAAPGARAWTRAMWPVLAQTGLRLRKDAATHWSRMAPGIPRPAHVTDQEWTWDWTFYDSRLAYARPSIALEHENNHCAKCFGDDLWKVLAAGAALRVMIGYVRPGAYDRRIDLIEEAASQSGPCPHGEELVMLWRFGEPGWHMWLRSKDDARFERLSNPLPE
jgi:hypothetical protein